MKNRIIITLLSLFILCAALLPISANKNPLYLIDGADIFSEAEEAVIQSELSEAGDELKTDLFVVTVPDFGGYEAAQVAEDYVNDRLAFRYEDKVMLLVSMDAGNRELWIFPYGEAEDRLTDSKIDTLLYDIADHFSERYYTEGIEEYISGCKGNLSYNFIFNLIICLVIGFVIAFIVTLVLKGQLKSVRSQAKADNYLKKGSLTVSVSRDLFLYRNVTRTEKPKNNGSSGSARSSSSGGSSGRGVSF